jgi:hypothetical protein
VHKRGTIFGRLYGPLPDAQGLIDLWTDALVVRLLKSVWEAYSELHHKYLQNLDWSRDYDELERSINQEFERKIRKNLDAFMPVNVQHGPFETESRADPPAQSPQYDIAFVWNDDSRIMWPLEAKVLRSDKNTAKNFANYIDTVVNRYLTCYYAPFSTGGAMIGYLMKGDPNIAINAIASRLSVTMVQFTNISDRYHWTSDHLRSVPKGKPYPTAFQCHHIIFPLGPWPLL